jgi:hypothetical protein
MGHARFGQQADLDPGAGLFVIGDQSASRRRRYSRSATIRPHSERTSASSGSQSPFIVARDGSTLNRRIAAAMAANVAHGHRLECLVPVPSLAGLIGRKRMRPRRPWG